MKKDRRNLVAIAMLLSNMMTGMDATIINTALPAITSELEGLEYMGWIVATYLLGLAVSTPLWSKFGEHQGNKKAYIYATIIFAIGAIFQGMASNIQWFIIARVIMGIGGGGMNTIPFIAFADMYEDLTKRSQIIGLSAALFSIASIIGPLVGGWIIDTLTWRLVFYLNVPVALLSITVLTIFYEDTKRNASGKSVDYKGAILLVVSLILILTGIQRIGKSSTALVILLLILGIITILCLIDVDKKAEDPIIPSRLFSNKDLMIDYGLFIIIWGSFVAITTYLPVWAQGVLGVSALIGGMTQIPGAITNIIGSGSVSFFQSKSNKYLIVSVGIVSILLSFICIIMSGQNTPFWLLLAAGGFEGFGSGVIYNVLLVNVQADAEKRDIPTATSLAYLLRVISQTLMSSIYGIILNHALMNGIKKSHNTITMNMLTKLNSARSAKELPQTLLPSMRKILYTGYQNIMLTGLTLIIISMVVIICMLVHYHRHNYGEKVKLE